MRLIAFITEGTQIWRILDRIGAHIEPEDWNLAAQADQGCDTGLEAFEWLIRPDALQSHWDQAQCPWIPS
jgi:hypothetical protein